MSRRIPVAVCFALALASCSPSGPTLGDPELSTGTTDTEQSEGNEPRVPVPAADAVPGSGRSELPTTAQLSLAVVGEAVTDPLDASVVKPTDMVVLDFLYDGLTTWDVESETWALSLAAELEMSSDGMSWTATLGATTFTDGSELLAGDVERSFRRVMEAESSLAAARLEIVESVEALDDRSVRFELSEPFADFGALLSSPVYGVVPTGVLDGSVGSGPMAFSDPVTLMPREDLLLGLSGVLLEVVPTSDAAISLWVAGGVDLVYVGADYRGEVGSIVDSVVEAHYVLNAQSENLVDLGTRRAVLDSISRTSVVVDGFGEVAIVIERLVPRTLACEAPCGGEAIPEAVAVAPLSLAYATDSTGREERLANALVGQLIAAGIDAEATGYDLEGFIDAVGAGGHDLIRTGWVGLFPSPDSQLSPYMARSADNVSGYADATFDGLIKAARTSGNRVFYDEARAVLDDAAIVLPLARLQVRVLSSDNVEGLRLRHDGSIDLRSLVVHAVVADGP